MPQPESALGFYVHIPFCRSKCCYCDFNSYSGLEELIPAYVAALEAEMGFWAQASGKLPVVTIYFGGGTPSLLNGQQLGQILKACARYFALDPKAEIGL